MRLEKKYLVEEVNNHLDKSGYVIVARFNNITVDETAALRKSLAEQAAEYHVVKNTILNQAASGRQFPEELGELLTGPTAIVVGGENPSEVAKIIAKFEKDTSKIEVKAAVLDGNFLSSEDVVALSKLPSLDALRAQFLGLISKPAQQMVMVLAAPVQQVVNVLQAKADQGE